MEDARQDSVDSARTGKYRALLELGQGGTAVVYLAVAQGPVGFNKLVVLKALKRSLGGDAEFRRMFLNEARLSARLNHPNIVQVNEIVEQDGLPVIVMEYLEGKPLSEVRARVRERFDLHMHLRILSDVLSGLHYSHELRDYDGTPLNVVHRDMSPHNVFVTYDGRVKVLDFGIAKLSGSLVETQTGVIKGKLRYMPPEQISGEHVDRRADIYAAGVMLWEAITGTRMWGDLSEATIMNRVLNGDIPSPRDSRPDISPELERICMKSLAYEADSRYGTAEELQTDLDAALGQLSASITLRDIGQFVSRHFEDSRVRTRQVIEQQLKEASLAVVDGKGPVSFPPPPVSMLQRTYTASGTNSAVAAAPEAGGSRKLFLLLLVLLVGIVGIVAFQRWRAPRNDKMADLTSATRSSAPAVKSAASDSSAAHSEQIMVRITVFPLAAKIVLDDKALDSNPYVGFAAIDQTTHRVDAQAPGYASATTSVTFNRNVEVVLTLVEDKTPKPPAGGHRWQRPAPKPPDTSSKPPPRNNCDPPFYVDDRGVKKFKPGCL